MIENEELVKFCAKYQEGKVTDKELCYYFYKLKRSWYLKYYEDKSGILLKEDFESIAYFGYIKALKTYNPLKNNSPHAWIYMLVKQAVVKEIISIFKKSGMVINSHMDPNLEIENYDIEIEVPMDFDIRVYVSDGTLIKFIKEIQGVFRGKSGQKIGNIFQLKLMFPNMKRETIAKIIGYSRRNGIAKPMKKIRAMFHNVDINTSSINSKFIDYITKSLS
ncbi:MAG TPA: hypothetical protein VI815_02695 [Candidatus Nanoarchaeia archaeon]|nr:hypothetical protein [Candidatus Nanoarchaeia archaeon]